VPGIHHRKRVAGVEHGVEQVVALDAGQADREMPCARMSVDGITSLISGMRVSDNLQRLLGMGLRVGN
jgi:hypothetical protein